MRTRKRLQFASALALGLALVAPLMTTTAASAALPGTTVLFFSNDSFTDIDQEDLEGLATIQTTGATVTVFDGGDGSDTAWTAALAGIDVLVLPEPEGDDLLNPGGTSAMSVAAAAVLKAWVTGGGTVVAYGAYGYANAISYLTGLDYASVWSTGSSPDGSWARQPGVDASLPAALPDGNATAGIDGILAWDPSLLVGFTAHYLSDDGDNAGVASFAVGAGSVIYLGYDWYPDEDDLINGTRDNWNAVLSALFVAPAAVEPAQPALAETGADLSLLPIGGGMLLLGLAAMLFVRKRSAQRV